MLGLKLNHVSKRGHLPVMSCNVQGPGMGDHEWAFLILVASEWRPQLAHWPLGDVAVILTHWPLGYSVCEIVFAEVIDHRSSVKMIHRRPTVYTSRLVRLSWSKTHEITIDHWATRLDSLPSLTQFLPRSGPRSMGKVAHWILEWNFS